MAEVRTRTKISRAQCQHWVEVDHAECWASHRTSPRRRRLKFLRWVVELTPTGWVPDLDSLTTSTVVRLATSRMTSRLHLVAIRLEATNQQATSLVVCPECSPVAYKECNLVVFSVYSLEVSRGFSLVELPGCNLVVSHGCSPVVTRTKPTPFPRWEVVRIRLTQFQPLVETRIKLILYPP